MFHFIPKPIDRVLTRQERIIEQRQTQMDLKFAWYYSVFLLMIFSACTIGSLFASKTSEIDDRESLYLQICQERKESLFCTDRALFDRYVEASIKKWVPPRLVFGIMYAESSLHTNYNKPVCKSYNSPFWLKGYKRDDWSLDWYTQNRGKADKEGCWLYKFSSLEEGLNWLLNTLSVGYKKCEMDTRCISFAYVGSPEKAEESWIGRVSKFYPNTK